MIDEIEALCRAIRRLQSERTSVAVGIRRVVHARHQRAESATLDSLACGQRQRPHASPMETAEKRDDVLPAARIARQLDTRLDRFGPRVPEKRSGATSDRCDRCQFL